MEDIKKVPVLRFPEFSGEWEVKMLEDIATFSKGKGISKADIVEDGDLECIRYGELYTVYGETIKNVKSKTNLTKDGLVLSKFNDVIIPASGETQLDIATASCVLKDNIALGGDLNIIRTKLNGVFLSYYLNNTKRHNIASLSQGVSVVHLYATQLKYLNLNIPLKEEQQKIADFLTKIDSKIEKLTKKKKLLESYKKGVMQNIFSQELRFKDEDGNNYPEWEEKKLGDFCLKKSSNISANSLSDNEGEYKIYGATGLIKKIDFYKESDSYISIVKDGAGVGRVILCEKKSSVLGTLYILKTKNNNSINFLYIVLQRIFFLKYIVGSTIPHIYFKDFSLEKIKLPSIKEQIRIADFLTEIDNKINLVEKQLTDSKKYKKSLLQKMFI